MHPSRYFRVALMAAVCFAPFLAGSVRADEGVWKTAYYKRGFVGNYKSDWAGGLDAAVLARTPMAYGGTQVRVSVQGCWDQPVNLSGMSLVRGADNVGHTQGSEYPVTFAGISTLALATGLKTAVSDPITAPMSQGTWYVKDRYTAATAPAYYPYAYEVDNEYVASNLSPIKGTRTGITNRIDVLTTDTRPAIVFYGDSITAGYNSTPNTGNRYPEIFSSLKQNHPVLNLGVNGDLLTQARGSSSLISGLSGVGSVVYLMGINDLINNTITTTGGYTSIAQTLIDQNHQAGRQVYWGTILPATGYAGGFDASKEALRQSINTWIRTQVGADGVIDFDLALRDPSDTTRMLPAYQSDWLHPNDAGYQKMAETAAAMVPEPVGLTVLSLGGLALLARRRRA